MNALTTEELLHAVSNGTMRKVRCEKCNGTGTKFTHGLKSKPCPVCLGKRELVEVPRAPLRLPITPEWSAYFNATQEGTKPARRK